MASSPPISPLGPPQRPLSGMIRTPRSTSRLSMSSKQGGGSRASDDEVKTSVKVGMFRINMSEKGEMIKADYVLWAIAVRVRPPLNSTDPGFDLIPRRFQRSMIQVTAPTNLTVDSPQGRKLFVFDKVFGEEVDQDKVWEYLSDSVNAFVQGYNVSVLAYGQSGAGKSYTMGTSGPTEQSDPRLMGMFLLDRSSSNYYWRRFRAKRMIRGYSKGSYSFVRETLRSACTQPKWIWNQNTHQILNQLCSDPPELSEVGWR